MAKLKADVLVIMPHPDDAEFGCAGTVARWAREGKHIVYVLLTDGDKGTSDRSLPSAELAVLRRKEQEAAAAVLGVREVVFLGYPDQGLEDTLELRKDVVYQIRLFQPDTVVTLDPYRRYIWHRDHRIAGQVVLDAVFPYARDHLAYPDLLEEGLEPWKVREMYFTASDDVNCRIDITDTFGLKMQALACHGSQVGGRVPEVEKSLRRRAEDAAGGTPFKLAECFHHIEIPG
ncbi:MAG: PIG-L family deacetylase [Dehalococcoidia bacterium]|nr:PIG-L family deacetylase [Dehalococcoidia bacterium]